MTSLPIQLPDDLVAFINQQVKAGRYKDVSEFIASVIERERRSGGESPVSNDLEASLEEAIASGEPIPIDEGYFDRLRDQLRAKHGSNA